MTRVKLIFLFTLSLFLAGCLLDDPAGSLVIGQSAPSVRTKKAEDVNGDLSRLTSYRYPDARMYQYSIDEALKLGKPILLEFATPGHCTVCDKQLQMLKAMIDKYGTEVNFLHMDQYMNPEAFISFQVKGDPWTFLIDGDGVVRMKQPGRMLYQELDIAISSVVGSGGGEG